MLLGMPPWDTYLKLVDGLIALGLAAIVLFLVMIYIEQLTASLDRWLRLLAPQALLARLRHWWLLHKGTH